MASDKQKCCSTLHCRQNMISASGEVGM